MPHNLTETAAYDATVQVPDDGDVLNAASVAGTLIGFQPLANRTKFLNQNVPPSGVLVSDKIITSTDGATITVGAYRALYLGGKVYQDLTPMVVTPVGLAASTWYYLYYHINAGVVEITVDTVGPDATNLVYKSGDTNYVYICPFRTTAGSTILPFRGSHGSYRYHLSALTRPHANIDLVSSAATNNVWTTQSLAASVPPTAVRASVDWSLSSTAAGAALGRLRRSGDTAGHSFEHATLLQDAIVSKENEILVSGQALQYLTSTTTAFLSLSVVGFEE